MTSKKDDDDHGFIGPNKLLKCACCKQMGHSTQDCEKDPNFKTHATDVDLEEVRIAANS